MGFGAPHLRQNLLENQRRSRGHSGRKSSRKKRWYHKTQTKLLVASTQADLERGNVNGNASQRVGLRLEPKWLRTLSLSLSFFIVRLCATVREFDNNLTTITLGCACRSTPKTQVAHSETKSDAQLGVVGPKGPKLPRRGPTPPPRRAFSRKSLGVGSDAGCDTEIGADESGSPSWA